MAINAKFQADFSSFLEAVDKAELKLADFSKGANKVEASLNRMVDNFSGRKLIQEAALMTVAIGQAGGASTLTARELQNAGAKAAEAADKMRRLGYEVPKGIQNLADAAKQAADATDRTSVSFGTLVSSFVTGQAIIRSVEGAFHSIVGAISASISAANDAEIAHVKLVTALRAQGTATPSVIAAFQGYASALQKTTIYQDNAVESAAALLVQVGNVMPRDMEKALLATTNLASGLGIDLATAALSVAKAAEGNTTALRRAGVIIDETKAKSQGFGFVLDEINKKFAGQAEAIAGTYQGRLKQLGNTWDNVEESVGRAITTNQTILDVLDTVNRAIESNTRELSGNAAAEELISDAVIGLVRAFTIGVQAIDFLQSAYARMRVASDEVVFKTLQVGVGFLDLTTAIGTFTKFTNPVAWTQTWKDGMRQVADESVYLKGAMQGLQQDAKDVVDRSERWSATAAALQTNLNGLVAQLESTRGQTKTLKDVTDGATDAWQRHTVAVNDGKDAISKFIKNLADLNEKTSRAFLKDGSIEVARFTAAVASFGEAADKAVTEATALGIAVPASVRRIADEFNKNKINDLMSKAVAQWLKDLDRLNAEGEKRLHKWADETGEAILAVYKIQQDVTKKYEDVIASTELSSFDQRRRDLNIFFNDQLELIKAGTTEGSQLQKDALDALSRYYQAAFGKINTAEKQFFENANTYVKQTTVSWASALGALASAFQSLGQISDGAFSRFAQHASEVAKLAEQFVRFAEIVKETGATTTSNLASMALGFSNWASAAITAYQILSSILEDINQDAAKAQAAQERVLRSNEFHATALLTSELTQAIHDINAEAGRNGTLVKLNDIIAEMGGAARLTADQLAAVERTIKEGIFIPSIETGRPGGAETINPNFDELDAMDKALRDIAESAVKSTGLVDQFFIDMIHRAHDAGLELAQVNAFIAGQVKDNVVGGITAFTSVTADASKKIADIQEQLSKTTDRGQIDKLNADLKTQQAILDALKISSQGAGDALAGSLVVAMNQMQKAGMPILEIMKQLSPSIDELGKRLQAGGFSGGPVFEEMRKMAALASDEVAGPVISALTGLGQTLAGLHNIGELNQDAFTGLTDQIVAGFNALDQQGKGGVTALRLLQQPLQTIWQLQHDYHLEVDDATQALLDQAEAAGIVGEDHKTISEQMLDATKRIADAVEGLARVFGVVLPNAAQAGADKMQAALDGIHMPEFKGITFTPVTDSGADTSYGSRGGVVTPHGIEPQYFAKGGRVLAWPFMPKATDTVPAMLTPGEMVLPKNIVEAFRQNVTPMPKATDSGGDLYLTLTLDGSVVTKTVIRNIRYNKDGAYTEGRGALGLAS